MRSKISLFDKLCIAFPGMYMPDMNDGEFQEF
jgi:hypothetical protein